MTVPTSAGARLRAALAHERPLQVVGTVNAFSALLAERAGFRAIYLSGAGVANASFGLPDLGITTLTDMVDHLRRMTNAISRTAAMCCGRWCWVPTTGLFPLLR
jgi:methylisocitrate lyase